VWYENGQRRQCEAVAEDKLAVKLAKVTERLGADAPNLERPGADLIAWYLSPDRHPAGRPWSRRHADTQRRLCARFVAPVIAAVACQDIRVADMQKVVNAAPTVGRAPGCAGACPPWSRRGSPPGTWPTPGCGRCTGRPQAGPRRARR